MSGAPGSGPQGDALPPSLLGCFASDPEPTRRLSADDGAGALDLALPAEMFAAPPPVVVRSVPSATAAVQLPARALETKPSLPEAALPAIGSVIEKYRVERLLGTGGFAAVYRATHLLLRIPVALKLLKPKVLQQRPRLAELLCEEASFAAQLNHPNVVRVFDVTHNPRITYIVMEYIDGEALVQTIRREGRLKPPAAIRIGLEVTRGLRAAYEQGLIHRDIKPANILVNKAGTAKIVDLGLALHHGDVARGREDAKLVVGTPLYMAPEQAARPEEVDFRADVYSLGATLYHAVTGHPPFDDDDPMKVLNMHQNQSLRPPEEIVPGLPFDLSRMLVWMLQKDRSARPDYNQLLLGLEEAHKAILLEDGIADLIR